MEITNTSSLPHTTDYPDFGQRFNKVLEDPWETVDGTIWGVFCIVEAVNLGSAIKNRLDSNRDDYASKKRLLLSAISTTGTVSNTLSWANRVRLFRLNECASFLAGVGYATCMFISGSKVIDAIEEFNDQAQIIENSTSEKEIGSARQKQTLALLKLAAHISSVAWGILGIISICLGAIAVAPFYSFLLITSVIFLIGEKIYEIHIQPSEKGSESALAISK